MMSLRYTEALEAPVPKMEAQADQLVIKVHASLPYTGNWEESDPQQKCFKVGEEFYNVVERRYENDTLYFTLQRNVNVRDQFDALSSIMHDLSSGENAHKQPLSHHTAPSAKDFLTVFSPSSVSPAVVMGTHHREMERQASIWHYAFFVPTHCLSVSVPPPDCA
jgi:D-tyrosyl-tRNA(Tyr) deacylase